MADEEKVNWLFGMANQEVPREDIEWFVDDIATLPEEEQAEWWQKFESEEIAEVPGIYLVITAIARRRFANYMVLESEEKFPEALAELKKILVYGDKLDAEMRFIVYAEIPRANEREYEIGEEVSNEMLQENWDAIQKARQIWNQALTEEFKESDVGQEFWEMAVLWWNAHSLRYITQIRQCMDPVDIHGLVDEQNYDEAIREINKILPYEQELPPGDLFDLYLMLGGSYAMKYGDDPTNFPADNRDFLITWEAISKGLEYYELYYPYWPDTFTQEMREMEENRHQSAQEIKRNYASEYTRRTGRTVPGIQPTEQKTGCMSIFIALPVIGYLIFKLISYLI